jgi:hypothetical protein
VLRFINWLLSKTQSDSFVRLIVSIEIGRKRRSFCFIDSSFSALTVSQSFHVASSSPQPPKLTNAPEESLLVLRGLGIQTTSSSSTYLSTHATRFIPTTSIQDIFIHEAFKEFEVRFYLAIVVEGEQDVVVVFPVSFTSTYFVLLHLTGAWQADDFRHFYHI